MLWGCESNAKQKVELDGTPLLRCPKRLYLDYPEDMRDLLWYYQSYKKGALPDSGGLLDQPAKMMECFKIIDGALSTIEHQKHLEAEQERARAKNAGARGRR